MRQSAILLFFVLFFNLTLSTGSTQSNEWSLQVLQSDERQVLLELNIPAFDDQTIKHDGEQYHRLGIAGWGYWGQPGQPQLPMYSVPLGMPWPGEPQVTVIEAQSQTIQTIQTIEDYRLYPVPDFKLDGSRVTEVFTLDSQVYSDDAFYPGPLAEAVSTGFLRDQPIFQLRLYPFQYNPAQKELQVYRRIKVLVTFPQGERAIPDRRRPPSVFDQILEQTLFNYESLPQPSPPRSLSPAAPMATLADGPQVKLKVEDDGLYRVTRADLQAVAPELVQGDPRLLALSNRGTAIPILFEGDADGSFDPDDNFVFYGQGLDSDYTRQNVYWLKADSTAGLRMAERDGTPGAGDTPAAFVDQRHYEQDDVYRRSVLNDGDHWFWDRLEVESATPASADYTFDLHHLAPGAWEGTLHLMLQSSTYGDHSTQIYLNEAGLLSPAEQLWSGRVAKLYEIPVSQSLLAEGSNALRIEHTLPAGESSSIVYVNWFELSYQDTFSAENDLLSFSIPSTDSYNFELNNFTTDAIGCFDITDPAAPVRLINTTVETHESKYRLRFGDDASAGQRYLAQQIDSLPTPSLQLDEPSTWKSPDNGATYLIITHPDFYDAIQSLAAYRGDRGEAVVTVKTPDIYDEFLDGIYDPQAIRSFLAYTYDNWTPRPVYVLLVGDASVDPKNNLGGSLPDLLPAHYLETPLCGQAPNDSWYAKVHGDDDYPDLIVGRIPVRWQTDIDTVLDKIQTYEESPPPGSWARQAVLVADDGDVAFGQDMDTIAAWLPASFTSKKMYGYDPSTSVQAQVSTGALLLAYSGHGNTFGTSWGSWEGEHRIFYQSQMQALENGNKLPFMTVVNCLNGLFDQYDRARAMAEEFLLLNNRGGIASWAPSSCSFPSINGVINETLYEALLVNHDLSLGSATTTARIQAHLRRPDLPLSIFEAFVYFGDPAVRLNLPASLEIQGQASPDPVTMGELVTYTLTYTLSDADQARGLILVNTLPQAVLYQSADPEPSAIYGQTLTWNLGDTPAGSYTVTLAARVSTLGLTHGQTLQNQVQLYDENDGEQTLQIETPVHDSPITGLTAGNDGPSLLGDPTTFSAQVASGTNVVYTWDFGDGSPPQAGNPVQHTYSATGAYTATLTAENGVSSQQRTTMVEVGDVPPIAGFGTSSPDLLGQTTLFQSSSRGTNLTYRWNFGDGTPIHTQAPTVSHRYTQPGQYTAILTISNKAGSDTASNPVEILPAPVASFVSSSPDEIGQTTLFTNTGQSVQDGTCQTVYDWDFGDGASSVEPEPTYTYSAVGTYLVSLTAHGCLASDTFSDTVSVTDVPISDLTVENDSPTLLGSATTLSATVTAGTNVVYTWHLGDGSPPATGTSVQHIYASVGAFTAYVTATNSVGHRVGTTEVNIADVPPNAYFVSSSPDLISQTTTFQNLSTGTNLSHTWNFGDGSPAVQDPRPVITHVYSSTGSFGVILTATNSAGTDTFAGPVKIVLDVEAPVAGFVSSSPDTIGQTTTFINTSQDGADDEPNIAYAWDFGDGTFSAARHPTHTYTALGTYLVSLAISNSVASDTYSDAVQITDAPIKGLALQQDSPTVLGDVTTLSATVTAGTNVVYRWDLGDGTLGDGPTLHHTYADVGTYVVVLTATNSLDKPGTLNPGRRTVTGTVTIVDAPIQGLDIDHSGPTRLGSSMAFTGHIDAGTNVSFLWDLGDGVTSTLQHPAHTYGAVEDYTVILVASNQRGSRVALDTVTVQDVPISGLRINADSPTPLGYPTGLAASVDSGSNISYRWDLGDGTTSARQNLWHTYDTVGDYTVVLTATNGQGNQVASDTVSVFTPDEMIENLVITNSSPTFLGNVTAFTATLTAGTNVTYVWDFGDGVTGTRQSPTHTYAAVGDYAVVLTATNSWGDLVKSGTVSVLDVPIEGLRISHDGPTAPGIPATFRASITAGTNVIYNWDFGDGHTETGQQATHTYPAPGTFTVMVQAFNGTSEREASTTFVVVSSKLFLPLTLRDHAP